MSAIAGILHFNNEPVPESHSRGLMKDLEKYPGDDIHTWQDKNVFLGCHAQWITPESVGEQLPYYDYERRLAITADAIIDNREELFEKFGVKREDRKIMPDSQLIILAYSKWGEESPKHLIGDFAFMIWDERKQHLFGARDFSGSRTLYYHQNKKQFVFSTTIIPLFTLPYLHKQLNEEWLAEFLAIPEMINSVDTRMTPFQLIEQVPPSHYILVKEGKVSLIQYMVIDNIKQLKLSSNGEYEEAFRDVFNTAVRSTIRTHRKIGSQLSGGLDSGAVVSFAARNLNRDGRKLYTYSSIPEASFTDWTPHYTLADERPLIHSTVNYVGNIIPEYLSFDDQNPYDQIDSIIDILESPYKFFENSVWLKGIYQKAEEDDIGVLLSGARGNLSISWGPALDYYAVLLKKFNVIKLLQESIKYSRYNRVKHGRVLKVVGRKIFQKPSKSEFPLLIDHRFAQRTKVIEKLRDYGIDINENGMQNIYTFRKNHFQQLFHWQTSAMTAGKFSLSHKLLKRDPSNDIRVVRFCLSLPENQFVQNGWGRSLIRRATDQYLPDTVRLNQLTRGIQGADWIHRMTPKWNIFTKEIENLIEKPSITQYLNKDTINLSLLKVKMGANPEKAFDPDFRLLMRGLIVSRFIKKLI